MSIQLRIILAKQQVLLGDQPLSLPLKWVAFLALLGLALVAPEVTNLSRSRDGQIYVSAEDVAELEWFGTNDLAHRKTVRRFIRDLPERFAGRQAILSPHGGLEKQFRFDPELVSVTFDRSPAEVARWLNLSVTPRKTNTRDFGLQTVDLALVEALIETHQFAQAEAQLEVLHGAEPEDELLVRVMLTWSFLRERQHRLADAVDFYQRAKDLQVSLEATSLEPLFELQSARLARADGDFATAEKLVRRQLSLISDNAFVLGRLETLAGLLILDRRLDPMRAEVHLIRALECFSGIHCWWGVQASAANLGLMWWSQLVWLETNTSESIHANTVTTYLSQAQAWFDRAEHLCATTGLRHQSPELLIYQAKVLRRQDNFAGASQKLEAAMLLAREWQHDRSVLEVMLEQADLNWQVAPDLSRQVWREALGFASQFGWRDQVLQRIAGRLEMARPPELAQRLELAAVPE